MSTIVDPTNPIANDPLPNGGFDIRGIAEQENRLEGSENPDIITGGNLNDVLSGFGGDDTIAGGAGDDGISGGDGNDELAGEAGNNVISGGSGENMITGGDGDDRLIVSASGAVGSSNTLTGGEGQDTFQLNFNEGGEEVAQTSIDRITDFQPGEDRVLIQGFAGTQAPVYNTDTGILSLDDFPIAQLSAQLNISGEDIEIVGNNNPFSVINNQESTVYRFYDPTAGAHFYTSDEVERDSIQANLPNYIFEGESYSTVDPTTGAQQVYRFFNPDTGVHLYTTNEVERDSIIENLPNFQFEGIKFHAYETPVEGSIPIYRFYEPSLGVHFYTPNEVERDSVQANLPNYNYEGIAYYAKPVDENIV